MKWTLNRAQQSENITYLRSFSNIDAQGEIHKQLQPSSILSSEKKVQKLLRVLTSEYINPFDPNLDKDKLYNLSSGTPVGSELAREILDVLPNGKTTHQRFVEDRLESTDIKFHDPIKRQKLFLFSNGGKKMEIKANNGKSKLGKLLSTSAKHERIIDFEKALEYPLTAVPLSLANADRSRRMTQKSALMAVFVKKALQSRVSSFHLGYQCPLCHLEYIPFVRR